MDKWKLLRSALQGRRDSDSTASIHRNDGIFSVIKKESLDWEWIMDICVSNDMTLHTLKEECKRNMMEMDTKELCLRLSNCSDEENSELIQRLLDNAAAAKYCHYKSNEGGVEDSNITEVYWHDPDINVFMPESRCFKWLLPSGEVIYTREKSKDAGMGINQLFSHKLHGVDNTGNVKVWAAESMLLHVLLCNYRNDFEHRSVLELGGGLSGLCGQGLAAAIPNCSVIITDGHPECVANQKVCCRMNALFRKSPCGDSLKQVTVNLLRWSKGDQHHELANIFEINKKNVINSGRDDGKFDRIIAADCLFFRDFHEDLVWLLSTALAPDGMIFLLQPRRGGTMDEFLTLAETVFSIAVLTDYDTKITELHTQYLQESDGNKTVYDPDIHYPILLVLTHNEQKEIR